MYTHVSFHQDDYLGPCHAIGCYFDRDASEGIDVSLQTDSETSASTIHCNSKVIEVSASSLDPMTSIYNDLDYHSHFCEITNVVLNNTEEEIMISLSELETFNFSSVSYTHLTLPTTPYV